MHRIHTKDSNHPAFQASTSIGKVLSPAYPRTIVTPARPQEEKWYDTRTTRRRVQEEQDVKQHDEFDDKAETRHLREHNEDQKLETLLQLGIHCVYIIEGIAAYKSSIDEVCIRYNKTGTVIGSVVTKSMPFGYSQSQLSSKKVSRYGKHVCRYAALELVWTYVSAPVTQAPERIFQYLEDILQMLAILRRNECAQTILSYGTGDKA
ncbi:hypothetical protein GT037_007810 [Alternaria burnsii]|uniref:Uncharacterized protein n=1 Tax=Alternaria burnsii TaxID=1187904 RepID=A0A8H7B3R3_9PLEO|nr:uncharacterized protein GT037_007810 [Alternaria burnsii]KAF7674044.1 hypothetical protein GT037_007810 [Alternaria burnsii]